MTVRSRSRLRTGLAVLVASVAIIGIAGATRTWLLHRSHDTLTRHVLLEIETFRTGHGRLPYLCELRKSRDKECDFSALGTCLQYYRQDTRFWLVEQVSYDEVDAYDSQTNRWTRRGAAFPGCDPKCLPDADNVFGVTLKP